MQARCIRDRNNVSTVDVTLMLFLESFIIWREATIKPTTTFLRKSRLRWYVHVLRKEGAGTTKKILNMQEQGKRRRGIGGPRRGGWTTSGMT